MVKERTNERYREREECLTFYALFIFGLEYEGGAQGLKQKKNCLPMSTDTKELSAYLCWSYRQLMFHQLGKKYCNFFYFPFFLFWNAIVVVVLACTCLFFSWISLAQSYLSACKFLSRSWTMDYYQCEKPFTIKLNKWSQILKTVSIFIFLFLLLVGIYALAKSRTRGFEINMIHFVWFIAKAHSDTIS